MHVTNDATVTKYLVNDEANTPDLYRIKFPKGSRIMDRRKKFRHPSSAPATKPAPAAAPAKPAEK